MEQMDFAISYAGEDVAVAEAIDNRLREMGFDVCVKKLLDYEQSTGIQRPSEYERILTAFTNESNGAFAKTYQLVKDKRKRDPLGDVDLPPCENPAYQVVEQRWSGPCVMKKLSVNVVLPRGLPQELAIANLKHCAAVLFNANKPNAILVRGYFTGDDTTGCFTAGRVIFASGGDWGKAQDGYAYNLPVSEFRYDVTLEPDRVAKAIEDFGGNPNGECSR